jgi:hypothetical protein
VANLQFSALSLSPIEPSAAESWQIFSSHSKMCFHLASFSKITKMPIYQFIFQMKN